MQLTRLLTAVAAAALAAGAAHAQSAAPAAAPAAAASPPMASTDASATAAAPAAGPAVVAKGDIVETARASGQFNTFLKAADATNLTSLLKTNQNLTVFAPTDAAFAALPAGELDRLMQPANRAELQKILTYHIINARVDSTKIKGAKGDVPTVAGAPVELDGSGTTLAVNDAHIVQADVTPTNGVIHVIDKVLMPNAQTASASAGASGSNASTTAPSPAAPAEPAAAPASSTAPAEQ